MIDLDQFLHGVVQQAGQDDFLGHAVFHSVIGALQAVVGGGVETQLEEIDQGGLVGQWRAALHIAGTGDEQIANAAAGGAGLDLGFNLVAVGNFFGVPAPSLIGNVELKRHVVLERIGLAS